MRARYALEPVTPARRPDTGHSTPSRYRTSRPARACRLVICMRRQTRASVSARTADRRRRRQSESPAQRVTRTTHRNHPRHAVREDAPPARRPEHFRRAPGTSTSSCAAAAAGRHSRSHGLGRNRATSRSARPDLVRGQAAGLACLGPDRRPELFTVLCTGFGDSPARHAQPCEQLRAAERRKMVHNGRRAALNRHSRTISSNTHHLEAHKQLKPAIL